MGPSGSGKSTLLAVLSGLLQPDGGQALALGQDIWKQTERQREDFRLKHCGFIFQGYNLFAALTARQQLEMVVRWGEGAPARDAPRRADEMLTLLGLGKKSHLRPIELSGGEKQRVAIGRALIKKPALLRRRADQRPGLEAPRRAGHRKLLLQRRPTTAAATVLIVAHDAPHHSLRGTGKCINLEDGSLRDGEDEAGGPSPQPPHDTPPTGSSEHSAPPPPPPPPPALPQRSLRRPPR